MPCFFNPATPFEKSYQGNLPTRLPLSVFEGLREAQVTVNLRADNYVAFRPKYRVTLDNQHGRKQAYAVARAYCRIAAELNRVLGTSFGEADVKDAVAALGVPLTPDFEKAKLDEERTHGSHYEPQDVPYLKEDLSVYMRMCPGPLDVGQFQEWSVRVCRRYHSPADIRCALLTYFGYVVRSGEAVPRTSRHLRIPKGVSYGFLEVRASRVGLRAAHYNYWKAVGVRVIKSYHRAAKCLEGLTVEGSEVHIPADFRVSHTLRYYCSAHRLKLVRAQAAEPVEAARPVASVAVAKPARPEKSVDQLTIEECKAILRQNTFVRDTICEIAETRIAKGCDTGEPYLRGAVRLRRWMYGLPQDLVYYSTEAQLTLQRFSDLCNRVQQYQEGGGYIPDEFLYPGSKDWGKFLGFLSSHTHIPLRLLQAAS